MSQQTANIAVLFKVTFSQQQLNDIEPLATKLSTELQSMKGIVVYGMQCESKAGAKSRYSTNEVGVALENAQKAKEMANKWHCIMTRDCIRFCKIMNGQKERRKIAFADEVRGSLCHVGVLEAAMII